MKNMTVVAAVWWGTGETDIIETSLPFQGLAVCNKKPHGYMCIRVVSSRGELFKGLLVTTTIMLTPGPTRVLNLSKVGRCLMNYT